MKNPFAKALIITLLLSMSLNIAKSQELDTLMYLLPEDVKPGFILNKTIYKDSAVYGYINGGADLYFEYGMRRLLRFDLIVNQRLHRVEMFDMPDSAAAFGLYSISHSKCLFRNMFSTYECLNNKQVQFIKANYYISVRIIMPKEDSILRPNLIRIEETINKKPVYGTYAPPAIFNVNRFVPYLDGLKLIRGPLGFQNGYPDWADRFEGLSGYECTLLPIEKDSGSMVFARVSFKTEADLIRFKKMNGLDNQGNPSFGKKFYGSGNVRMFARLDQLSAIFIEMKGDDAELIAILRSVEGVATIKK